jgi:alkylation response protein AidB-like acyl-CoA dehydrogenase
MDITFSADDLAFRDEVRAFLDHNFTPELREASRRQSGVFAEASLNRTWHRILYERGWIAPSWPRTHGGTGWSVVQKYIYDSECAEAGTPVLPAMGLQMCGPVLIGCGTDDQKARFLPKILSGEHYWCQGYSEPGAGSDLASLQCRAVRDGDDYVIDGSKIWTTHAQNANWMFLLVRTKTEGKPQAGITFLLVDMKTPGITVRPIISISGEHEVNAVFFEDVRVPVANRVGQENDGWTVAKYLLEFERGGSYAARLRGALARIKKMAADTPVDGASLLDHPDFRRKLSNLEVEVTAVDFSERRVISSLGLGRNVGNATASMLKLRGSETTQKATELALEVLGVYAAPFQREAMATGGNTMPVGPAFAAAPTAQYLNARASTIFGGSSEIQRNILSRAALGL